MTVNELIACLQALPADVRELPVVTGLTYLETIEEAPVVLYRDRQNNARMPVSLLPNSNLERVLSL
ncbi:hypothetical protein [Azotobacter beijerinckii]|uniref:hypothetical protein n=1 Tax=Azotobacter beijerinckii TaxID=170623 RepID=UPI002954D395|nr:hypothetical protein [Azotobacter beijerinckii]MDV7211185.1 hypothetical protein [Azotobacter beijerinckii]